MGNEGKPRKIRSELVVGIITAVLTGLGLVPLWVPFLEDRGYDAGWLRLPLQWVRRWWWVLFGVALAFLVVYLLWLFRRELVRRFKLLGQSGKRFYLRGLWQLVVKLAREQFGVEAVKDADAIKPSFTDVLRERMRGLDADGLWVLEGALARRKPGSNEALLEFPDGMRLDPMGSGKAQEKPRFEKALDGLKNIGAIVSWEPVGKATARDFSIRVVLPTAGWKTLERLRVAAEAERARRSIMEVLKGMQDAAPIVRAEALSTEEAAWVHDVEELSIVGAWLLHRILHLHRRYRGEHVLMDAGSLKQLAQQMGEGLQTVLEACDGLLEAGFLSSASRTVEQGDWQLVATVGEKVKGMKVAQELMSAIESRLSAEGVWGSG